MQILVSQFFKIKHYKKLIIMYWFLFTNFSFRQL